MKRINKVLKKTINKAIWEAIKILGYISIGILFLLGLANIIIN